METADLRSVPPGRARGFAVFAGVLGGLAVLSVAGPLAALPDQLPQLPAAFWTMAGLAVVSDARPFTPPGRRQTSAVFPSICFTFAILLAWGLGPAVVVQTVAALVASWRTGRVGWRTLFDAAQYACALAAAHLVVSLAPVDVLDAGRPDPEWAGVVVAAVAAAAWFAVKYGSTLLARRLSPDGQGWRPVRQGLVFDSLAAGSLLLLAPVLTAAARVSAALIPLVLVPLFAVYRMARLSAEQGKLARLDPLTGLPNRKALLAEVAEQLQVHREPAVAATEHRHLALLLLDLDRFKHVNDAVGHAGGDRLLIEVGNRLTAGVRPGDLVARLGGDEFASLAGRLRDAEEARDLADQVLAALAEPVALDGLPLDVGGSIGIALHPGHGEDFATLMRHADVAMYDAKHRGDTVAVYAPESDHNSAERLSLLADLRRVLDVPDRPGWSAPGPGGAGSPVPRPAGDLVGPDAPAFRPGDDPDDPDSPDDPDRSDGQDLPVFRSVGDVVGRGHPVLRPDGEATGPRGGFGAAVSGGGFAVTGPGGGFAAAGPGGSTDVGEITMYYQPQVAIDTGEVVGVEALLRWRHPRRGMVDPEELIRVAEQSAVMRLLTRRVVDDVVEQLARWTEAGTELRAAVNVSVRDLHTGEIADQIADRLARYGVPPARLQLEITEGALMADPRRVLTTISRLDKIGVAIALDDFGTGYSSMQHLRRLPLSEVKVDRSFVLGMAVDADDAAIVHSMIELAGALGLRVVAEGVEDERTWRMLHAAGCDVAQGWFYARPMPAAELADWLARYRPLRPGPAHQLVGRHRLRE
ncbi:MAG TPA: bifunctional diguanylate cyclase/phosphodiesterase [Micromonospora sp.]